MTLLDKMTNEAPVKEEVHLTHMFVSYMCVCVYRHADLLDKLTPSRTRPS